MADELLQRVAIDALESGTRTPDMLRAELEAAIERFSQHLSDDTEIRYGWALANQDPSTVELFDTLEDAQAAPHDAGARLRGYDKRAGWNFDVENYELGTSTTVALRIDRRNLHALRIPIEHITKPRTAFLVETAPGVYRLGGRALRPAAPLCPSDVLRETGISGAEQPAIAGEPDG